MDSTTESSETSKQSTGDKANYATPDSTGEGVSERERREESSKAAKQALDAQSKAKELTQAAAGAGDPEERQNLLNEALSKEIEAESFGKTAKYLQSGSFQGLLAGGGLGAGVGTGLGTLTGVLVGGVASFATGGLGAGLGAGIGALHGPFIDLGEVAGEGLKKITGTLPEWEATDEQKKQLEKVIGEVHKQDRPSEEDLQALQKSIDADPLLSMVDDADKRANKNNTKEPTGSWREHAASYKDSIPSVSSWLSQRPDKEPSESTALDVENAKSDHVINSGATEQSGPQSEPDSDSASKNGTHSGHQRAKEDAADNSRAAESKSSTRPKTCDAQEGTRKELADQAHSIAGRISHSTSSNVPQAVANTTPKKLENKGEQGMTTTGSGAAFGKRPRKLEVRS